MRLAHVSDLHVLAPAGVQLRRVLFNKRITGFANLIAKRGRVYRREYLLAALAAAQAAADHVVVTGDITNLSLEPEYDEATRLLDGLARTTEVSVVPGNHDIYLPVTLRERRFPHHFARFMRSDLANHALDLAAGRFPWVKLRGPLAIIGLSSAVPRPPFVSAGLIGRDQLAALGSVLADPEVARRTPVILVHHSPFDAPNRLTQLQGGLIDAPALRAALQPLPQGLVLYGHLHLRLHYRLPTAAGALNAVCASAAPLDHADDRVRCGFNLYTFSDDGRLQSVEAHVLDPATNRFVGSPLAVAGAP